MEKVNSFYVTFIKQLLKELMLHNPDHYSIIIYLWITHLKIHLLTAVLVILVFNGILANDVVETGFIVLFFS